ncbi:MAG: DUF4397 domain-containing protein [Anaerolineae bacterium]|nr:DUF4397 domain-containing protein [Anaerolineae bacterium]
MFKRTHLGLLFILLWMLAACAPTVASTSTPPPTSTATDTPTPLPLPTATVGVVPQLASEPAAQGTLRIVQAAPESGSVDVYLEQALIGNRMSLGAFTNPVNIAAGEYVLQVVPTGALPNTTVLTETVISVQAETSSIILVTGTADALTISVFAEDLTPIPAGQSRITLINAIPRGPQTVLEIDEIPLSGALDFGQVSGGTLVEAAHHQIDAVSTNEVLGSLDMALAAGRLYTAVLVGQVGGSDAQLIAFNTFVVTPGHLRVIHAAPDLPAVDVYLDDTLIDAGIGYRSAGAWVIRPPRSYELRIVSSEAGEDVPSIAEARLALSDGQAVGILLYENRGLPALQVFASPLTATPPLTAHLLVINAAPDAANVSAQTGDDSLAEIPAVRYGMASRLLEFPQGMVDLLWVTGSSDAPQVIEAARDFSFEAGITYTYIVTGDAADTPFVLADATGIDNAAVSALAQQENEGIDSPGETTTLRVINALADRRAVSVSLDDTMLDGNLPAISSSDTLTIRAARYTLTIGRPARSPEGPDFYVGPISLLDETGVVLLLYGTADAPAVTVLASYTDPRQPGQAVLRVLHADPDLGGLFVTLHIPGIDPTPGAPTVEPTGTPLYPASPTPPVIRPYEEYQTHAFGPGEGTDFIGLPANTYRVTVTRIDGFEEIAVMPELVLAGEADYELLLLPGDAAGTLDLELLRTD